MASDAHGSHRKHRRSSSPEEVDRSSKRQKHRHGHRHHRYRHGSRKREEEPELDTETVDKVPSPTLAPNFDPKIPRPDDDVEEEEILEEEGSGGGDGEIGKKHTESDAESGEIMATGGRGIRSDNSNPVRFTEDAIHQKDAIPCKETVGINVKGSETNNENIINGRFISPGSDGEDDTCHQRHTGYWRNKVDGSSTHSSAESLDGKRARASSDALGNGHLDRKSSKEDKWQHGELGCFNENEKLKGDYDNKDLEVNGDKVRIHRKNSSPESGGGKYRTRESSPSYRCGSRSRSSGHTHNVVEEYAHFRRRNDGKRIGEYGRERGHVSRDLMAGDRRDSREARDRGRSKDRDGDRDLRREKEREKSHEKDRRDAEKDRSRGREVDRYRRREKERDRDRSWEIVAERGRIDRVRERSRDRARFGERERVQESERDDKHRERDKIRERERHKDRNTLDKDENLGYEHGNESRDREMRFRHSRHEGAESHQERKRNSESVKVDNRMDRGEDEQDDLDETATLQFAEQEEEDLNRIKEESRRRREAILEKYKMQQPQQHQQAEQTSENKEKDF